jgi:hypothetical protein
MRQQMTQLQDLQHQMKDALASRMEGEGASNH